MIRRAAFSVACVCRGGRWVCGVPEGGPMPAELAEGTGAVDSRTELGNVGSGPAPKSTNVPGFQNS